ncbi:14070_t:CDS:2 [Acaulospora morrowiae]|uniref:14070_t:CDS:1 n=1 Tax=Acaulospora morrowiae TaxID=94023 RepID=A0A9N8W6L4_9GLOM|nr:14070_t:CDS:2 [Acaulospora morrowiae]
MAPTRISHTISSQQRNTSRSLIQKQKQKIREEEKQNMHIILLGDFNENIDPHDDCTNPTCSRKDNSLITYLLAHDYIDTYRELHPHTAGFIYTRPLSNYGSRIDYIWISPNLANSITKANILASNTVTSSDYKIITAQLIAPQNLIGTTNSKNLHRSRYDFINTTARQWKKFTKSTNIVKATLENNYQADKI